MHCTQCGTKLPANARFCSQCGAPVTPPAASAPPTSQPVSSPAAAPARAVTWESKNYQVPLDFEVDEEHLNEVRQRYDEIVGSHLYLLSKEGWEPDGPTDFHSMREAKRLRMAARTTGFLGMGGRVLQYKHVVIRIKRRLSS